jgi:hypothetical protein
MSDEASAFMPSAIHRAIDQATVLKVELHRLRERLRGGEAIDEDALDHLDDVVDQLSENLIETRDQDYPWP